MGLRCAMCGLRLDVPSMLWQGCCPYCKSHRIGRVRLGSGAEAVLGIFLRCRCQRCDSQFFKYRRVVRQLYYLPQ
jgi:hypothetical protein